MEAPTATDFTDIQGLVVRSYGQLPAATFLLLAIRNRSKARRRLRDILAGVTFANRRPTDHAVNLALSHHGLVRLGVDDTILSGFSNEFRSGMVTPHKRRILGDQGAHAPENWLWGGPETPPVDVLLLCYGASEATLAAEVARITSDLPRHGLAHIHSLDTITLPDFREHFGFRDSIGQPWIAEFDRSDERRDDAVPLGEFVLGYRNGYGLLTPRPLLEPGLDPGDRLAPDPEGSGARDLGLNGTYLVFRQLAQDVPGFWRAQQQLAGGEHSLVRDPVHLAAKMVGRWPSGAPLVLAPDQDQPDLPHMDDFLYHAKDAHGTRCPLGAHIRRTHPRDSLDPEPGSERSIAFSNRHRLLRRGRAYGAPFVPGLDPQQMLDRLNEPHEPVERGLHFICLNANIGRQFEFVQHTWADNPNFNGLRAETDPIIGHREVFGRTQDQFRVQHDPLRCKYHPLPEFVTTRGGGYFFLPSRRALQYLFSDREPRS